MTSNGPGEGWLQVAGTVEERRETIRQFVEQDLYAQLDDLVEELHLAPAMIEDLAAKMMPVVESTLDAYFAKLRWLVAVN